MSEDGSPAQPGLIPTLEESVAQKVWIIGTPEEVAEGISAFGEERGGIEHLTLFPSFPGDTYDQAGEQVARLGEQVLPLL